jgi:formate dehydrogenase subunit delta
VDTHKLVKMANEIAAFFHAEPDQAAAIEGVAGHIRRFWDPRMRRELVEWVDEHDGEGLSELAAAAVKANRNRLLPQQP